MVVFAYRRFLQKSDKPRSLTMLYRVRALKRRGGELMNKKYIAFIAAVVVVVIAVIVVAVLVLPGIFTAPVDISGINLATARTTDELLPMTLADKNLIAGSNITEDEVVTGDTLSFHVTRTSAQYNGVRVYIIKAPSASDASETLGVLFDDDAWYGGASSSVKTNDWFTASKGGRTAFFWKSDIWVFGIDAENDTIRNNAAKDLVQYLKSV
jgi:hypothetical protein